jgi:hypothetical protein
MPASHSRVGSGPAVFQVRHAADVTRCDGHHVCCDWIREGEAASNAARAPQKAERDICPIQH